LFNLDTNNLLKRLNGILLPTTTPFDVRGEIDLPALRENVKKWCGQGITGIVALGSTGERVHLNEREYLMVVEATRATVPPDLVYIVGAGQQSIVGTINEVKAAAGAGADAVLVLTPHFYRSAMNQETLLSYYTQVADACPVPVVLYSMPALTGIKIDPVTIAKLSEHQNIFGVKDSSNDTVGFSETVKLCPREFATMTGNGTVLLDALLAGATGGILAVGCAVPDVCVEEFRAFRAGDIERATEIQSKLTPLAAAVTTRFGIGGLKKALDLAGYRGGEVRAPLSAPNPEAQREISDLLESVRTLVAAPIR